MTIRIVLGDDHRLFREALRAILSLQHDMEVVGEGGTGTEILEVVANTHPDVLLLDIALRDINGIDIVKQCRKRHPDLKIIALTGYADRLFVEETLKAGAQGYVVKSAGADVLFNAIRMTGNGRNFLSTEAIHALVNRFKIDQERVTPPVSVLSPRERQVLQLLAAGNRSIQIAKALRISPATVDVHRRNIKKKLKVHSIAELTLYAAREGLARL